MNETTTGNSRLLAWCQLVRVPNLLTVPGDPLVGFLLMLAWGPNVAPGGWGPAAGLFTDQPWLRAAIAATAAVLLYTRGLITNDVFDLAEDRRDRPRRPLPSGRIGPVQAARAAAMLGVLGVATATLNGLAGCAVALMLVGAILAYNGYLKRVPVAGPLCMGLCRSLSVLLGAAAGFWQGQFVPVVLGAAALVGLFIAAVTLIAAGETQARRMALRRWGPLAVLMLMFAATIVLGKLRPSFDNTISIGALGLLLFWAMWWGWLLGGQPAPGQVQRIVGQFIGGLMFIQAALATVAARGELGYVPLYAAAALLVGRAMFVVLAKRFYAS